MVESERDKYMNEELESVKLSLQNINDIVDIKGNPVVSSVLMAPVKAIPIIGDLIDSSADALLDDFQKKKEQELIDVILTNSTAITTEMVNDVEFIINYARVVEAVKRLATNDKIKFFGNLIRNGYLSGVIIEGEYRTIGIPAITYIPFLYLAAGRIDAIFIEIATSLCHETLDG